MAWSDRAAREPLLSRHRIESHTKKPEKERTTMSTITITNSSEALLGTSRPRRAGLLARVYGRMIEARTRAAERRIAFHLEGLSDQRLADLGLTAAEIATLRARRWRGRTR
jgi:uncharacterized protein YjiS (DUF1127 family)